MLVDPGHERDPVAAGVRVVHASAGGRQGVQRVRVHPPAHRQVRHAPVRRLRRDTGQLHFVFILIYSVDQYYVSAVLLKCILSCKIATIVCLRV